MVISQNSLLVSSGVQQIRTPGKGTVSRVPSFPLRRNSLGMIAPSGESPGGRKRWHLHALGFELGCVDLRGFRAAARSNYIGFLIEGLM